MEHPSLSPCEDALEDADADIEELQRRISDIITAWERPGFDEHQLRIYQEGLRLQWPQLADAIAMACVLDSLDKANDTITHPKENP